MGGECLAGWLAERACFRSSARAPPPHQLDPSSPSTQSQSCGLHRLHSYSQEASDAHRAACGQLRGRRDKVARDRLLECGICLERCAGGS